MLGTPVAETARSIALVATVPPHGKEWQQHRRRGTSGPSGQHQFLCRGFPGFNDVQIRRSGPSLTFAQPRDVRDVVRTVPGIHREQLVETHDPVLGMIESA